MRRARTAARAPATSLAHAIATMVLVTVATGAMFPTPDTLSVLGAILPPFVSERFEDLVKAASDTCEVLPQQLLFSRSSSLEAARAQLVRFSSGGRRALSVASAAERARTDDALVLYVPGWLNTPSDPSSRAIVRSLMTKHSSVYLLDTRLSFCRGYVTAVSNVTPLSYTLFGFIKKLHKAGYPLSSIHLIGFSLGAHVAGVTGKLVRSKLNSTLGRITALDPARPCFARTEHRLDKRDASFVHVIHSSTGVLGIAEPVGHADVYLNGVAGKHPACRDRSISLECDHAQAWRLYSASALDARELMARRCASWDELLRDACGGAESALGYACSAHGMFLHKSRDEPARRQLSFNPMSLLRWPFGSWLSNSTNNKQ